MIKHDENIYVQSMQMYLGNLQPEANKADVNIKNGTNQQHITMQHLGVNDYLWEPKTSSTTCAWKPNANKQNVNNKYKHNKYNEGVDWEANFPPHPQELYFFHFVFIMSFLQPRF